MSDVIIYGPSGAPLAKATGQLPDGAVASSDLSGLAQALGGGLSVTSSLGPGTPIGPAHPEEGHPRWFDYVPGANVTITPRQGELYGFELLYGIANTWDVSGIAIEKRKDEFLKLEPSIRPRPIPGQTQKQAQIRLDSLREQIADAMGFLETPDQQSQYPSWLGRYLDDLFKGDCATYYLRGNVGGGLAAVEVPDGTTIKPIIDLWGRIAQVPPGTPRHVHEWSNQQASLQSAGAGVGMACAICGAAPGYAQVIKGMIWGWYGSDEIIYQPRWLRGKGPYGHPPLEAILLSANRALRRQSLDLAWYTEGTLPAAFLRIPESWSIDQGKEFLAVIDALYSGNDALRSRMIPIPGGPNAGVDRVIPEPKNDVEEYLLHVGCAVYGVSPMEIGFIRSSGGAGLGGKGVAEEQTDAGRARQISLAKHLTRVYNRVLSTYWTPDLVLYYPSLEERKDQKLEAETLHQYWMMGAVSSDWVAENVLQLDPPGLGNTVVTGQGMVVPIAAVTAGAAPGPTPSVPPTPSAQPGVNTGPVAKALGAKHVEYTGDLATIVHRYLLRSYPSADVTWVLDRRIDWEYDPDVPLAELDMGRRPGGRNEQKVAAIASAVEQGASMDPAVFVEFETPDPAGLNVADGFHRTLGVQHAGKDAVPGFVGRHVPDEFRELITEQMQADSSSKHPNEDLRKAAAADDLRRWRQKAIRALRRGESAAVSFESDAIPAPTRELVTKALAGAESAEAVWAIFGGGR